MHPDFDPQPTLRNGDLALRPLARDDFEDLYAVAQDPGIWAGHPAKNRHERAIFEPYFHMLCTSGGTLAIKATQTDQIIGCSRYYAAPDQPNSVSIGFTFLGRAWWGGVTNFTLKTLMLDHAFAQVSSVWLHIDPSNIRSQRATAKLGAVHAYDKDIGLGGKSGLWQCWRLNQENWAQTKAARPNS